MVTLRWVLAVLVVWCALGCGSSSVQRPPPPLHLRIVSSADSNGGTALHVLVRKTTRIDYPREEYDDVAGSLQLKSDPATLEWLVVSPGRTEEVVVSRPGDGELGVYFLFSDPGARWRELVDDASIEAAEFQIGRDQIQEARLMRRAPKKGKGR